MMRTASGQHVPAGSQGAQCSTAALRGQRYPVVKEKKR